MRAARFAAFPALQLFALWTLLQGGGWTWAPGAVLLLVMTLTDGVLPGSRTTQDRTDSFFDEAVIWVVLLLATLTTLLTLPFVAAAGSPVARIAGETGDGGPPGLVATVGAVLSTGFLLGLSTPASHELFHRTKRGPWYAAQLVLAQYLYAPLAIEHVFGHHRRVGFADDVTTAARGQSFWNYFPRAIVGTYAGAARLEAARLRRAEHAAWGWRNRFLHGLALQAGILWAVFAVGGWTALAGILAVGVVAILAIEVTQYISHYGLVRAEGHPFANRHAWNDRHIVSSSIMFNLHRHSAHHRSATRAYWALTVPEDAPVYPAGIGPMALLSLVPPLFFRVTDPLLDDWADRLASPEERALMHARTRRRSRRTDTAGASHAGE